jgi:hypothetical protein
MKIVIWIVALAAIVSALPVVTAVSEHDMVKGAMGIGVDKGQLDALHTLASGTNADPIVVKLYNDMVDEWNPAFDVWNSFVQQRFPGEYSDLIVPDYQKI